MTVTDFGLVLGIGINDADYIVKPRVNGKSVTCQIYQTWTDMLKRCYCPRNLKRNPTYIGCTVTEDWLSFMVFRSWMMEQDWEGMSLDKDIIDPGNKVYCPDKCAFVSMKINNLLGTSLAGRGDLPLGVSKNSKRFRATIFCGSMRQIYLGTFDTPEEASVAYGTAKAEYIRNVAAHQSDPRVTSGLLKHAKAYELGAKQ